MTPATSGLTSGETEFVPLSEDRRLHRELEEILSAPVTILPEVPSTNEELIHRARRSATEEEPLPDLYVMATDFQCQGRGRLDRTWVVAPGEALTFSVLLRPTDAEGCPVPPQTYGWLTLLLSSAVIQALVEQGIAAEIKWPNDVLVGGRKMVGVLASLVTCDHMPPAVVVGAGINVSTSEFPVDTATSVQREGGHTDRAALLRRIMELFVPIYRRYCDDPAQVTHPDGALRRHIEANMTTLGRQVRAELPGSHPPILGRAVGLDAHGALIIQDTSGIGHHLSAGDVVHLRGVQEGA